MYTKIFMYSINKTYSLASDEGRQTFAKYGKVLRDKSPTGGEVFRELNKSGWRIAEISVSDAPLSSMSFHRNSPEAFIPVGSEKAILTLSIESDFVCCESFEISEPVIIFPCIWHGLTSKKPARLLVAENADVSLETKDI